MSDHPQQPSFRDDEGWFEDVSGAIHSARDTAVRRWTQAGRDNSVHD